MRPGRPRKLDENSELLVKVRVDIARSSKIINEKDIAVGFSLSTATLRRYYFPIERQLSLTVAKAAYEAAKSTDRTRCEDCHKPHLNHPRCLSCKILLHHDPVICRCGEQHGIAAGKYCTHCVGVDVVLLVDGNG